MNAEIINKKTIVLLIFIMSALTQAGLVLYTPAFLQISQSLHIAPSLVKFTLTGYLLGFGFSQLFYGPLSDRYGRKKLLLWGMVIFSIGCFWSIFAESYNTLLLSRIIQGIGAGSCMTLSRAILRDSFESVEYVKVATYLSSGFAAGLGLAPIIGGHLSDFFSWRADFIFLFLCGIILLFLFWLFLPETHYPKIIDIPFKKFFFQTNIHFYSVLKNKMFISYLIAGVLAYGVVITYNTMAPFLFQKTLGYSASFYGWLTFMIAISYYAATSANRIFLKRFTTNTMIKSGLTLIFLSGISILASKILFNTLNLYVVFIPLMIATFGQALIWSISIANALKDLGHIAGTAAAFFSCLQMVLSAILSGAIAILHEKNQIPIGLVILILAILSWLIFQFIIFRNNANS